MLGLARMIVSLSLVIAAATGLHASQETPREKTDRDAVAEAQKLLKRATEELLRNPKSAFWHSQASVAYAMLGDAASAQSEIEEAIRLEPEKPVYYYMSAELSSQRGNLSSEMTLLGQALAHDPKNPVGHFRLGDALGRSGKLEQALREYQLCVDNLSRLEGDVYYDPSGSAHYAKGIRSDVNRRIKDVKQKLKLRSGNK